MYPSLAGWLYQLPPTAPSVSLRGVSLSLGPTFVSFSQLEHCVQLLCF